MSTRDTTLTNAGRNILAKCQKGQELRFTRVAMGDGTLDQDENLRARTELIDHKLDLPIRSIEVSGVGTTVMATELKNAELKKGFFAREIGIFAIDPDTVTPENPNGQEILYAYRNTGNDSEYVPAGGGSEVWNLIYNVITVVDQAENVTAVISGDVAYVTRVDLNEHFDSRNPHPKWLQIKDDLTPPEVSHFWAMKDYDKHLHPLSLDNARTAILGDSAATLPIMRGRINQLETELDNVYLKLLAENELPDSNLGLYEDFKEIDQVDDFIVKVEAATAGSDTICVLSLEGVYPGSYYWIADGVRQEQIQVKSAQRTLDGVLRVLCTKVIENTYNLPETYLYRTTAGIESGLATGSSDRRGSTWEPPTVWRGAKGQTQTTVWFRSSLNDANSYTRSGDWKLTGEGYATLDTSIKHSRGIGIALLGSGNAWLNVNEDGAELTQEILDKL